MSIKTFILIRINLFLLIFYTFNFIIYVNGHGRMIDPPQRGSMWRFGFQVPPNYNDMSNYCGGIIRQWQNNKGKCGVCGDAYDDKPREHEPGGKYASGIIGKTYYEGHVIEAQIEITANHLGYFEFRLCVNDEPMKVVKQDCFDKNLLKVLNNNEEVVAKLKSRKSFSDDYLNQFKYFVPHKNNSVFTVQLQLPKEILCSQCILQWKYHAGNNYGKSYGGDTCLGCAEQQEEFYNCADIAIEEDKMKFLQNWDNDANTTNAMQVSNAIKNKLNNKFCIYFLFIIIIFLF